MKTKADNENEKLTFITLAAATANVVRYLESTEQKKEQPGAHRDSRGTDEQDDKSNGAYVVQRLQETAAFERRAAGDGPARKRRN